MAVSVLETIKSRANAANTAYIVVVKLLCDDYSDLPAQSGLSGYELAQGCTAHVINENKDYMIDSSGNWHVYGGDSWTNVYTKSETDALLDDKQDELTTAQLAAVNSGITAAKLTADEAALAEVVDGGAKSVLDVTRQTTTISGVTFTVNDDKTITVSGTAGASNVAFNLYTGTNYIQNKYSGMILSDGSPESTQNVYLYYAVSNNGSSAAAEYSLYGNTSKEIGTFPYVRFAILVKANTSITNPITIKPMICTKAAWNVSQKFMPYAPTNRELYEMILSLQ